MTHDLGLTKYKLPIIKQIKYIPLSKEKKDLINQRKEKKKKKAESHQTVAEDL